MKRALSFLVFVGIISLQPQIFASVYQAIVHADYGAGETSYPVDYSDDASSGAYDTMSFVHPNNGVVTVSGTASSAGILLDAYAEGYSQVTAYGELKDELTVWGGQVGEIVPYTVYIQIDYYCSIESDTAGGGGTVWHRFQDAIMWNGILSSTGGTFIDETGPAYQNVSSAVAGDIRFGVPFTLIDRWKIAASGADAAGGWGRTHLDPTYTFYTSDPSAPFSITSAGGLLAPVPEPATLLILTLGGLTLLRKRK